MSFAANSGDAGASTPSSSGPIMSRAARRRAKKGEVFVTAADKEDAREKLRELRKVMRMRKAHGSRGKVRKYERMKRQREEDEDVDDDDDDVRPAGGERPMHTTRIGNAAREAKRRRMEERDEDAVTAPAPTHQQALPASSAPLFGFGSAAHGLPAATGFGAPSAAPAASLGVKRKPVKPAPKRASNHW